MRALNVNPMVAVVAAAAVIAGLGWGESAALREWSDLRAEHDRLVDLQRLTDEGRAFNRYLTDDLAAGRVGLDPAIEQFDAANAERPGFLEALTDYRPAPSHRESVARHLLARVGEALWDDPTARAEALDRLGDEYEALFGRRPPGDDLTVADAVADGSIR